MLAIEDERHSKKALPITATTDWPEETPWPKYSVWEKLNSGAIKNNLKNLNTHDKRFAIHFSIFHFWYVHIQLRDSGLCYESVSTRIDRLVIREAGEQCTLPSLFASLVKLSTFFSRNLEKDKLIHIRLSVLITIDSRRDIQIFYFLTFWFQKYQSCKLTHLNLCVHGREDIIM